MKKIDPSELDSMRLRRSGKKHPVRVAIEQLKAGEVLQISLLDLRWRKRTPSFFTNQLQKSTNKQFIVSTIYNNLWWIVQRVDAGD